MRGGVGVDAALVGIEKERVGKAWGMMRYNFSAVVGEQVEGWIRRGAGS
jgi:hypothetical protein